MYLELLNKNLTIFAIMFHVSLLNKPQCMTLVVLLDFFAAGKSVVRSLGDDSREEKQRFC